MITEWKGKPLKELSREELIKALKETSKRLDRVHIICIEDIMARIVKKKP